MAEVACPERDAVAASCLADRFELTGTEVYRGLASTVFLGVEGATLLRVVVKVLLKGSFRSDAELQNARDEIGIHAEMPPHRHVTHLMALEETAAAILLVMPYAPHGDLWSLIRFGQTFCEKQVRHCAAQILSSLRHTHAAGVVHCDVKPQNYLLSRANGQFSLQLCDFGLASKVEKGGALPPRGLRGTSGWYSPEMLAGSSYGQAVDMFGAGLILFRMVGGYEPFYPPTDFSAPLEFDDSLWCHISESCKGLIRCLLHVDPQKRISASDACAHPWIAGPPPADPKQEQLEELSSHGALPRTDVVFWPSADAQTYDSQIPRVQPEEPLAS